MDRTQSPHRLSWRVTCLMGLAFCLSGSGQATAAPAPADEATPAQARPAAVAQLKGFDDWVTSVAWSPDGKLLAAGSYDEVQLWDLDRKSVAGTLKPRAGYVRSAAFSPDGKMLALAGYQNVQIWDVAAARRVKRIKGHSAYVTGVAFSPDGRLLATCGEDESIRLVDASSWEEVRSFSTEWPVNALAFSPDGSMLATAGGDETRVTKPGTVILWNVADGTQIAALPGHQRAAVAVAFSPDGQRLVSGSHDETANIYDVAERKALGFYGGHGRPVNSVVFAPDSRTVLSGGGGRAQGGNDVHIWNSEDGSDLAKVTGHEGRVIAVALSPDAHTLATASYDHTAAVFDVQHVLPAAPAETKPVRLPLVAERPRQAQQPVVASRAAATAATQQEAAEQDAAQTEAATTEAAKAEGQQQAADAAPPMLRAGIIGLDTSHVIAFTKALNDENAAMDIAGCRVVAAYPKGSPDIESSTSRVPGYTKQVQELGVEIVDSIDELLKRVDVVMLETNDGRPHLEQALPVLRAGKPLFIDKPIAASLADAIAIFEAARHYKTPVFSSSSLRFSEGAQALRNGSAGDILGCSTYSPCSLEQTHPDLYWYGIHGVETLFTVMGTGCQSVTRTSTPGIDFVTGTWEGGRVGTFRGIRNGKSGYGGTAFGTKAIADVGSYGGYRPLVVQIVRFFRTRVAPVSEQETLEIYAFMSAADESKKQNGVPVTLKSVMQTARAEATKILATRLKP